MGVNFLGGLTIHLCGAPVPVPVKLSSLVELNFPGYLPAQPANPQVQSLPGGMISYQCVGYFVNAGPTGSVGLHGSYLVSGQGASANLVAFVAMPPGTYPTIPQGPFTLNLKFTFTSQGA